MNPAHNSGEPMVSMGIIQFPVRREAARSDGTSGRHDARISVVSSP
jgi:hypothetical protein